MNNAVLVVGGVGYIGSHRVLALEAAGLTVVVYENSRRGIVMPVSGIIWWRGIWPIHPR